VICIVDHHSDIAGTGPNNSLVFPMERRPGSKVVGFLVRPAGWLKHIRPYLADTDQT